jgi:hypothetical protein
VRTWMVPSSISFDVYLDSRYCIAWIILFWPLSCIWPTGLLLRSILSIGFPVIICIILGCSINVVLFVLCFGCL